jgi:hypothetical protein
MACVQRGLSARMPSADGAGFSWLVAGFAGGVVVQAILRKPGARANTANALFASRADDHRC